MPNLAICAPKGAKTSDSAPPARIGPKSRVCDKKCSSIERTATFKTTWESLDGDVTRQQPA